MGKFATNTGDYYQNKKTDKVLHLGVVESNSDEADASRIKVRIKGVDDHIGSTSKLPYAFPLVQKFIHIVPQVGESVWVMTPDPDNLFVDRLYIGPIISQPQKLAKDSHVGTATAGLSGGFAKLSDAPSTIPDNEGVYPKMIDVAIQGRKNTDIVFKDSEVLIRAGKYKTSDKINGIPKFNKENPSYIQLKQNVPYDDKSVSVTNVVSDKINLLTHEDGSPRFSLGNQESMISDKEMARILDQAHPLVFGDLLIEYLELFKDAMINHVHAYDGMKPEDMAGQMKIKKFLEFDVSKIISKNIKIN
jgi:hypothetical protein